MTAFCLTVGFLTRQKRKSILVVLLLTSGSTPFVMSQMPLMRHLQPGVRPTLRDSHADVLFLCSSKRAGGQQSIRSSKEAKKKNIYVYFIVLYIDFLSKPRFPQFKTHSLRRVSESGCLPRTRPVGRRPGEESVNQLFTSDLPLALYCTVE